jgi:hypothetical protein
MKRKKAKINGFNGNKLNGGENIIKCQLCMAKAANEIMAKTARRLSANL